MSGFAATGNKSVEPHGVEAAIAGSALGGGKALTVATVERNIKRKSPRRKADARASYDPKRQTSSFTSPPPLPNERIRKRSAKGPVRLTSSTSNLALHSQGEAQQTQSPLHPINYQKRSTPQAEGFGYSVDKDPPQFDAGTINVSNVVHDPKSTSVQIARQRSNTTPSLICSSQLPGDLTTSLTVPSRSTAVHITVPHVYAAIPIATNSVTNGNRNEKAVLSDLDPITCDPIFIEPSGPGVIDYLNDDELPYSARRAGVAFECHVVLMPLIARDYFPLTITRYDEYSVEGVDLFQ